MGDNNEDIEMNSWVGGSESILRVGENMSSFYGYRRLGVYTEEDFNNGLCEKNQIGRANRQRYAGLDWKLDQQLLLQKLRFDDGLAVRMGC